MKRKLLVGFISVALLSFFSASDVSLANGCPDQHNICIAPFT